MLPYIYEIKHHKILQWYNQTKFSMTSSNRLKHGNVYSISAEERREWKRSMEMYTGQWKCIQYRGADGNVWHNLHQSMYRVWSRWWKLPTVQTTCESYFPWPVKLRLPTCKNFCRYHYLREYPSYFLSVEYGW